MYAILRFPTVRTTAALHCLGDGVSFIEHPVSLSVELGSEAEARASFT